MPEANATTLQLPPAAPLTAPQAAGTMLGFDYGEKRIGVALGNGVTRTAQALCVLPNTTVAERFAAIGKLITQWQPTHLVVGFPIRADGTAQKMTGLALRFGQQLNGRFNLPVTWVDERFSTMAAEDNLRTKQAQQGAAPQLDAEAAAIILQQYFDEGWVA